MSLLEVRQQLQAVCQIVQDLDKFWQTHTTKSGHAAKEMMERKNWIQDKFNVLRMHIRCKGLSKLSDFKSSA